jgi:hypothetical protein
LGGFFFKLKSVGFPFAHFGLAVYRRDWNVATFAAAAADVALHHCPVKSYFLSKIRHPLPARLFSVELHPRCWGAVFRGTGNLTKRQNDEEFDRFGEWHKI